MGRTDALPLVSGLPYRLKRGKTSDLKTLLNFMQRAYQELSPDTELSYLAETVQQLWSEQAPFWLVEEFPEQDEFSGCVWLGTAIDPMTGDRVPHIFLLYIDPRHRRRGLGSALMHHAETWAISQGHDQLGLHVFTENTPALALYKALGYSPQSIFLQKQLGDRRRVDVDYHD
jgi:ribosomal protein S18 acetylase RimI-like enzyme